LRFESGDAKAGGKITGDERMGDDRLKGDPTRAGELRSDLSHATLVGMDAARLRSAPHFERGQWPKDTDRAIWSRTDAFFGVRPGAGGVSGRDTGRGVDGQGGVDLNGQGAQSSTFFRASKLQNQQLTDASGQPIGRIGDLAIDPQAGRVNYTSIQMEDRTGAGRGRTIAMPWESVRASRQNEQDRFQTMTPAERLNSAPEFTTGDDGWKQMSDPNWVNEMYGHYNVKPYWNQSTTPTEGSKTKPGSPRTPPSGSNKPIGKA
jgi:sporulation protein YlmC with PRC-barrel domain